MATLGKAVELSRQRAAGQPRRIVLKAGEYYLDQPIDLGPEDSGLTIEAIKGAKVVLYGGRRVSGWRRDGEAFWAAEAPEAKDRRWDFRMLVYDTGACGLKFGGESLVRNNHVHHVGRIYPSGIAVWGDGRNGQTCRIEHNTVHDTSYTAIACGGDDHRIARSPCSGPPPSATD